MSYKDILVFLDDGKSNEIRMKTAIMLAQSHGAKLTGVALECMRPDHLIVKEEAAAEVMAKRFAKELAESFVDLAKISGIDDADATTIGGGLSEASQKMARLARNYDLVMLRQPNPSRDNHDRLLAFSEDVMMHCGQPVFFMPYIGVHRIPCERALVAWDGSPSSVRALHNAIPLLKSSTGSPCTFNRE